MSLQFISDGMGKTTGVFIPIEEWNELKSKYQGIENDFKIPDWHIAILSERDEEYERNPEQAKDFNTAMDDIEKKL